MGGLGSVLKSLPGAGKLKDLEAQADDGELDRVEAIIFSMTPRERRNPKVLNGSRRERIASGAGVSVTDVNRVLKQFTEARKLMKQFQATQGKGRRRMRLPGMPGGFPGM